MPPQWLGSIDGRYAGLLFNFVGGTKDMLLGIEKCCKLGA